MKSEDIAHDLLYGFGFEFLMIMHIIRYSKEEGVSVSDVIQIFKQRSIDPKYVAYISYSGYQSFKDLISDLKEETWNKSN